jgi:lipopolysaccharide export system protein LptA
MRKFLFVLPALLAGVVVLHAQTEGLGDLPIEITASGETTYEHGVAIARDNVSIRFGDTDIYADYAQYNSETRDVFLQGRVRIYRANTLYTGDQAIYNLDSKHIQASDMRSLDFPYFIGGENVTSAAERQYMIQNGIFTTHDSSEPDFHLKAKSVRIYLVPLSLPIARQPIQLLDYAGLPQLVGAIPSYAGNVSDHRSHLRSGAARLSEPTR